jgi:aminoglycoside phosphotransferase (APT) family kinase protein
MPEEAVVINDDGLPDGVTLNDAELRLRTFVSQQLGTELRVRRFLRLAGGSSNYTYAFDVTEEGGEGRTWDLIVRWDPLIGLVEPYDMGRQYRIMNALQGSAVPIPRTFWLEEDPSVLGRAFFVVGNVEANIGNRTIVGETASSQARRRRAHVETMAAIHAADWKGRGMDGFMAIPGPGTSYALREIDRWEEVINRKLAAPDALLSWTADWMRKNAIETDEVSLLHGDCSGTNYMFKGDEVAAVIDWEMSTLGDPMVEVGWYCGCIETLGVSASRLNPDGIKEARREFLTTYADVTGRALDEDKIRFGEVFYNYQLCSVGVSGAWIRRQRGEDPASDNPGYGDMFRVELERLTEFRG